MGNPKAVVKKVRPYPIEVYLKSTIGTGVGQIQKLALQGFLAETALSALQPGDKVEVSFTLPVINHTVVELCKVVKIYNQWGGQSSTTLLSDAISDDLKEASLETSPSSPQTKVNHLVEFHFQTIAPPNKSKIATFQRMLHLSEI